MVTELMNPLKTSLKKSFKNDNFKISEQTFDKEFQLLCSIYPFLDANDCFELIIKKHHIIRF